jgi:hypothetical protein
MKTILTVTMIALAAVTGSAQDALVGKIQAAQIAPPPPPPPPPPVMRVPLESKTIKGAPYSAQIEIESIQTLSDGNRIVHRTTGRVYRDAQGRFRREEDQPSGQTTISIFDPEADVSYSLDVERRIAWKTPAAASTEVMKRALASLDDALKAQRAAGAIPGGRGRSGNPPDEAQARQQVERQKVEAAAAAGVMVRRRAIQEQRTEEALGSRMIEGVRADGIRRTSTIPAGEIGNELPIKVVSEEWTSPELQVLVLTQHNDPRTGQSTYRVLSINRSDPGPTLFQVPSDYTIRETGIRRFERR